MADYLSVVYDPKDKPYTDYPEKLANYLFKAFEMKVGMKILEPGCGRGEFLRAFKNLGMEASGLDISEETRKLLNEDEIDLSVCDVESETGLPFSASTVSVSIIGSSEAITPARERSSKEKPPVIIYPLHSLTDSGFAFQRISTGFIFDRLRASAVSLSVLDPGNCTTPIFIVIILNCPDLY